MYLRHEIGKIGEDLATKYLENLGYTIMERNFVANQGDTNQYFIWQANWFCNWTEAKTFDKYSQILLIF